MKNSMLLSIATVCFSHLIASAQTAPQILWQNSFGGVEDDVVNSVIETYDKGYFVGGYSSSRLIGDKTDNNQGGSDYWVAKLKLSVNIHWQNSIGGGLNDVLNSVIQTTDKGYLLGGTSWSNDKGDKTEDSNGGSDYWVVKLDETGVIQWQNGIGGGKNDYLNSVIQTTDGGYLLGGTSYSGWTGDKTEPNQGMLYTGDYWVVKLNETGTIQWQNTIGGNDEDDLNSVIQTSDGGYLLGGSSSSGNSGDKTEKKQGGDDFWVVKLNATGVIQWQNSIGGGKNDVLNSAIQTTDGGYMLGGTSESHIKGDKTEDSNGGSDYWVVKLDKTGGIQWQNTIGGSNKDVLNSIIQTSDGGYLLGGYSHSGISGDKTEVSLGSSDYWVMKLDETGVIQWQNTIGGSDTDVLNSAIETSDGGYLLGGYSHSGISGDKTEVNHGAADFWVVKLTPSCMGFIVFADEDSDGYGDNFNTFIAWDCIVPSGYVENNMDCNDTNAAVHPEGIEIGNGFDDDCNGIVDDVVCVVPQNPKAQALTSNSVELKWDPALAATQYSLHYKVANSGTWTLINVQDTLKIVEELLADSKYVWQVSSVCGNDPKITSEWSAKQYFITPPFKVSNENAKEVLLEIYPNPSSGNSTLRFNLTQSSKVVIKFFDVNGKEVTSMLNETLEAGAHFMSISTSQFSKGIYLVQLVSANGIQNTKLIVE